MKISNKVHALILAGNKENNINSSRGDIPQILSPIGNIPFLFYLLDHIKEQNINQATLLLNHQAQIIQDALKSYSNADFQINFLVDDQLHGSVGAIKTAADLIDSPFFLVLDGNSLVDCDLDSLMDFDHEKFLLGLSYQKNCPQMQTLEIDSNYQIINLIEQKSNSEAGLFFNGISFFPKKLAKYFPEGKSSLKTDLLPALLKKKLLKGIPLAGRYFNITTPISLAETQKTLPHWLAKKKRPCLFLDRDGIIIEDRQYVHEIEQTKLNPQTVDLIKWANQQDIVVNVLTNQAGIARGYYTEDQFHHYTQKLDSLLSSQQAKINATYFCPHHPESKNTLYQKNCWCRKPWPAMALMASCNERIDLKKSVMIGDKESDLLYLPGLTHFLIKGDYPLDEKKYKNITYENIQNLFETLQKGHYFWR